MEELLVKSDGGSQYVPFDDAIAAKSLGEISRQADKSEAA